MLLGRVEGTDFRVGRLSAKVRWELWHIFISPLYLAQWKNFLREGNKYGVRLFSAKIVLPNLVHAYFIQNGCKPQAREDASSVAQPVPG